FPLCLCDPAQLGSHSQLPRAFWAFAFPISTWGGCYPRPLALHLCSNVCRNLRGEKQGQCPNPASNAIKLLPLPLPLSCHGRATRVSAPGWRDEDLLPGAPEDSTSPRCPLLRLVCTLEPMSDWMGGGCVGVQTRAQASGIETRSHRPLL
ncbi:hypothetical protein MC885_011695, partial [Smutsia gigantea]